MKHRKEKDYNNIPFDSNMPAKEKAKQFDEQYGHNRKDTPSPNLDAHRRRRGDK